ncbi:MAG: methylthioribose-1-phosphate isomerase [Ignavibacteria bacterium]|nr:MAG: methylthioribose-1-phosphate isomerase [Ignavibacteria bacterium]KAF0160640.1 MAG: methylthioribose-1-phosphate isomerase [Ignavibacteria bacterium]
MKTLQAVEYISGKLHIIDQTKLPLEEVEIITNDLERISLSIERLEVRGAPAIGVTAAYALAIAMQNSSIENRQSIFLEACSRLAKTRPTAVNLFYALDEMKKIFNENVSKENLPEILLSKAISIHDEDKNLCTLIARNGLEIFTKKSRVLTHCHTGALATGGNGTALNIIRNAFENGLIEHVYADETRPLFQGSRLTAWELDKLKIPFSFNTDSTAAVLMQQSKVDLVITGADRIAANGDTANKIGTYNLAVLCNYHKIPFYIAAPSTTIDKSCKSGDEIKIELRSNKELTQVRGIEITKDEYQAYSPAFDVTPNSLITAIITEKQVYKPAFNFNV